MQTDSEINASYLRSSDINLMSSMRITTRRVNLEPSKFDPNLRKWVVNDFSPLTDKHSDRPNIENTTQFMDIKYTEPGSYMELGGFVLMMNSKDPNAISNTIAKATSKGFLNGATASVVFDTLMYS